MKKGYFGEFGGCFVPELLMPPLQELEEAMRDIMPSPTFKEELDDLLRNFAGRETPLTYCPTLSKRLGFSLWLKREDLLHTGAHKVNNTLGQALLAKHMGKTALVAETGAGQHGGRKLETTNFVDRFPNCKGEGYDRSVPCFRRGSISNRGKLCVYN